MGHSFSIPFLDIQYNCKTTASDTLYFIVGSRRGAWGSTLLPLIDKIAKARRAETIMGTDFGNVSSALICREVLLV